MRTRVKICGITNIEDAMAAINLGADALGFNMYEASPRYLRAIEAKNIVDKLPPLVTSMGLFVNESKSAIEKILSLVRFDFLQFHGDETDDFCKQFSRPFIKVLRVKEMAEVAEMAKAFPSSRGLLVDALVDGQFGGTGKSLNWEDAPSMSKPIVLAGGLRPENVGLAIKKIRPFGVDVSSGVEREPGKKNNVLMKSFIQAVMSTDAETNITEVDS